MDVAFPPGPVRTWTLTNVGTLPSAALAGAVALSGENASAFDLLGRAARGRDLHRPDAPLGRAGGGDLQRRPRRLRPRRDDGGGVGRGPGGRHAERLLFRPLTNQAADTFVSATPVRLTGFNTPITVTATGGGLGGAVVTTDGGATWASSATLAPGAFLSVLINTGAADGGTRSVVVTVADRMPDAVSFAGISGVEPGALVESATASIAGMGSGLLLLGGRRRGLGQRRPPTWRAARCRTARRCACA